MFSNSLILPQNETWPSKLPARKSRTYKTHSRFYLLSGQAITIPAFGIVPCFRAILKQRSLNLITLLLHLLLSVISSLEQVLSRIKSAEFAATCFRSLANTYLSFRTEKKIYLLIYSQQKLHHASEVSVEINEYPFITLLTYGMNMWWSWYHFLGWLFVQKVTYKSTLKQSAVSCKAEIISQSNDRF